MTASLAGFSTTKRPNLQPQHRPDPHRGRQHAGVGRAGGGHGDGGGAHHRARAHAPGHHRGRGRGREPAGQRPQLHRLRAAHARASRATRAAATSASPASAARSTAWSSTAPTTTTPSSARPSAAPAPAARPTSSARTRCRSSRSTRNAYSAEYGRAGGAVINVVTKSGTNDVPRLGVRVLPRQGAEREQLRSTRSATPVRQVALSLQPVRRHAAAGPIQKDRHFFFVNYDGQRQHPAQRRLHVTLPARSTHAATPTRRPASRACSARPSRLRRARRNQDVFLVQDRLAAQPEPPPERCATTTRTSPASNIENGGAAERARAHRRRRWCRRARSTRRSPRVLSRTLLNEVRASGRATRSRAWPTATTPEAIVRQGGTTVLTFGRNNFSPRETTIKRCQVADTVTWIRGAHSFKRGFDLKFDNILNFFPGNFGGALHVQPPAPASAAACPTRRASATSRPSPAPGTTGADDAPEHQRVRCLRAGRVAAARRS